MGLTVATAARRTTPTAQADQLSGVHTGRISSVRNGVAHVVLPYYDPVREFPCIVAIGVQGVGPATANLSTGVVTLTNATALLKGMLVLVTFPAVGHPWITSIAPSGAAA